MAPAARTTPLTAHSWLEVWAWRVLLALVALLPLTTSIIPGASVGTFGVTADVYHVPKLLLLAVLLFVATAFWTARLALTGPSIRWGVPFTFLAAFAALIAVSTAAAPEPMSSLFGVSGLSTGAITWLSCMWMCVLVAQHLKGVAALRELTWALIAGCTGVSAIALLGALGADPLATPHPEQYGWMIRQGVATVGNPDFTALLLIVPLLAAIALALSERRPTLRRVAIGCAALLGLACFATLTRAAWIGAGAGVLVFAALAAKGRRDFLRTVRIAAVATLLVVAVGTAVAGAGMVAGRFASITKGVDAFSSGRITMWRDTSDVVTRFPWFGTGADHLGLGSFAAAASLRGDGTQRAVLQDPHNLPLLLAGIFGIPALLAFLAFVYAAIHGARSVLRPGSPGDGLVLYRGWVAGFAGLLTASLLSVWTITAIFILFLTIGVVVAPSLRARDSRGLSGALSAGGVILVAVSLWGSGVSFAASREVALSQVADPQIHLEQAMRLVPWDSRTRADYFWRWIQGSMGVLTSVDAAISHSTTDEIDAEIRLDIQRFPRELMFYRLRMDLYTASKGYPGFRRDKLLAAIDDGLSAFPNDPEFLQRRKAVIEEAR